MQIHNISVLCCCKYILLQKWPWGVVGLGPEVVHLYNVNIWYIIRELLKFR